MSALKQLGIGAVSAVLILLVTFFGYNVFAINIGTASGDYFLGAVAVFVLLGGAFLNAHKLRFIGRTFMIASAMALLTIIIRHRAPGIAELAAAASEDINREAILAAANISAGREIPCDKTTTSLPFFDAKGRRLVWAYVSDEGRIICVNRPGNHPQTNRKYVSVDERMAAVILHQEPPVIAVFTPQPTPAPALTASLTPTPAPVLEPVPEATPVPELP